MVRKIRVWRIEETRVENSARRFRVAVGIRVWSLEESGVENDQRSRRRTRNTKWSSSSSRRLARSKLPMLLLSPWIRCSSLSLLSGFFVVVVTRPWPLGISGWNNLWTSAATDLLQFWLVYKQSDAVISGMNVFRFYYCICGGCFFFFFVFCVTLRWDVEVVF